MIFSFIVSVTMAIVLLVYLVIATSPSQSEKSVASSKEVQQPQRGAA